MADLFLDLDITTDAQALADEAIARLRVQWPDWEPNDADLEVILIEAIALLAANAADTAALVPASIFRKFGTDLIGVAYNNGTSASATLTFTLDNDGTPHSIPAGFEVSIDGYAFSTDTTVNAAIGVTTAVATASANEPGLKANGLVGSAVVPIDNLAWIANVTLNAVTAGGLDAEDDIDYQSRLSRRLELQAESLVTTRDYELMALDDPVIGRASAITTAARQITVTLATPQGEPVPSANKTALATKYAFYRLVNNTVTLADAVYTVVSVTYTVKAYPGFDATDLQTRINAALAGALYPGNWGQPRFGDARSSTWLNEVMVRKNVLIDLVADVQGVNYVVSLSITGSAGTVDGNGDLTMPGPVALTRAGTMTGTIT